ncbi:MAG: MGMT family protein [Methanomicrobiaceae archaeon]|nr:MGMT family protein [Methanomicrobiaceae archaeon]
MALNEGACRFGLWWVHVAWADDVVHRVRFAKTGEEGAVPPVVRRYIAGQRVDPASLQSTAAADHAPFAAIYRAVREVGYGSTATYGAIAAQAGTSPRVVGTAMKRNPTPLVIPCHRIVARDGIGGFTPDIGIKRALLRMEAGERRIFSR